MSQNRISFGKLTHYGPCYDVEIKPDPSNIAYTPHRYNYPVNVCTLNFPMEHISEVEGKPCTSSLTLTLTSSNYYMSPLSLSACFSYWRFAPFHVSLPNPSESERPFSPLGRRGHWAGGGEGRGTERNGFLCFAPGTPRHWPRRSQDPKACYHWFWAVGAGVVGTVEGRDGDWEWKGGGGVFFIADLCWHLSHWRFSKVCVLLIVPVG